MGRIGLPELIVVLVIVIVIFGANRLPQLGAGVGNAIKNFKNAMGSPDEPSSSPQLVATSAPQNAPPCRRAR